MEASICLRWVIKARSRKMGPTAMSHITLPLLAQPCAVVLSTLVQMWAMVCILGTKIWIWDSSAAIPKSLIVFFLLFNGR